MSTNQFTNDNADTLISWLRSYAAQRIDSKSIHEHRAIPPYIILDLSQQGFFGMQVSKSYGGLGLNVKEILMVLEQLAAIDMSIAILILDSILSAHTIENSISETVKNEYLPNIAAGKILSAVAITESESGSNPRSISTRTDEDANGHWIINGEKRWVGYASWASFITVFAQAYDKNGQLQGVTGFLVPAGAIGVEVGAEAETMGIKGFPKHTVLFNDVHVPRQQIC